MGGLISLIYSHTYDAPSAGETCDNRPNICRVQTVVTMGTPFFGSVSTIATPDVGWGGRFNWFVGGQNTIASDGFIVAVHLRNAAYSHRVLSKVVSITTRNDSVR